jgi:DNA mismatch repair protein MutL
MTGEIRVLSADTIDKIAAGEVVERPSSVAKELVENAIDAGATAITVEVKEGGIGFLRVTDNGSGMQGKSVRMAFMRHATSKIRSIEDLELVGSLGFRGEALSSIASVSKVEVITKTGEALTGVRFVAEGGEEKVFEEVGAPEGTTFIMRSLFYNTPVRRKFLKQSATEGGYIAEWMEHLALSRPDISFKFLLGNQVRFHTTGSGDLREVIYRIYGKEILPFLIPVDVSGDISLSGYLGKPEYMRSNRSHEVMFLNGRFVRNQILTAAVEEGYKDYLMQHKFPFCVLHLTIEPAKVDVNVHPAKLDVRFTDPVEVSHIISRQIRLCLEQQELIPGVTLSSVREEREARKETWQSANKEMIPEPFEVNRAAKYRTQGEANEKITEYREQEKKGQETELQEKTVHEQEADYREPVKGVEYNAQVEASKYKVSEDAGGYQAAGENTLQYGSAAAHQEDVSQVITDPIDEKIDSGTQEVLPYSLNPNNRPNYRLIGQVFSTYWLMEFQGKLYIMDQHAAHEKVKYERLMKQYREKQVLSQNLMPPFIISLTGQEEATFLANQEAFLAMGFQAEAFGGNEYALRNVPIELYGCGERELFLEVLDTLGERRGDMLTSIEEKIASMSCKAAVKGNMNLSAAEAESLLDELLTLENPYNCPHGRPTIITISKAELERKFKRII